MNAEQHAVLAPSSAYIWVVCHGGPALWHSLPGSGEEAGTDASEEGRAAHFVAATTVRGQPLPEFTPEGWRVDDDMRDGAAMWGNAISRWLAGRTPIRLGIEEKLPPGRIHPNNWGTPDVFAQIGPYEYLIADYKYGHRMVDAFENWQLINYAALLTAELDGYQEQDCTVKLAIVQPRSYHRQGPVRVWDTRLSYLRGHINLLRMAAEKAHQPMGALVPGSHCVYCPARTKCPALERTGYNIAEMSMRSHASDTPLSVKGKELHLLRHAKELIEARMTGLEAEFESEFRAGKSVPGWMMQQVQGREKWSANAAQIIGVGAAMGIDVRKPESVITPNQARKAGLPEPVIASLSVRSTSMTLAPADDKSARMIFG